MAGGARLGVLAPEGCRIESWPVGIEAPTPQRGMAGEAVALGMAGHTAFQVLACGLSVIQEKGLLRIMKAAAPKQAGRDQSRADMAVGAELSLVVAVVARAFPAVCCGGMYGEKAGRMVPRRCIGPARPVTLEALRPSVAGGARLGPRGRGSWVALGEVQAMRFRPLSFDPGPRASAGARSRYGLDAGRGADVTAQAAFPGMTAGATGRFLADLPPVVPDEARVCVARRCLQLRLDRQRTWIGSERLYGGHLRGVDVALGTEILGVARGAGGSHRTRGTRQFPMQLAGECRFPVGGRGREVAYGCPCELSYLDQWQMAGRAGRIGCVEV